MAIGICVYSRRGLIAPGPYICSSRSTPRERGMESIDVKNHATCIASRRTVSPPSLMFGFTGYIKRSVSGWTVCTDCQSPRMLCTATPLFKCWQTGSFNKLHNYGIHSILFGVPICENICDGLPVLGVTVPLPVNPEHSPQHFCTV